MNSFIKGVAFVLCVWNLTASVVYTSMHLDGDIFDKPCYGFLREDDIQAERESVFDEMPDWMVDRQWDAERIKLEFAKKVANRACAIMNNYGINPTLIGEGKKITALITHDCYGTETSWESRQCKRRALDAVVSYFTYVFPNEGIDLGCHSFEVSTRMNHLVFYNVNRLLRNIKKVPDWLCEFLTKYPRWGIMVLGAYPTGYWDYADEVLLHTESVHECIGRLIDKQLTWEVDVDTETYYDIQCVDDSDVDRHDELLQPYVDGYTESDNVRYRELEDMLTDYGTTDEQEYLTKCKEK